MKFANPFHVVYHSFIDAWRGLPLDTIVCNDKENAIRELTDIEHAILKSRFDRHMVKARLAALDEWQESNQLGSKKSS